MLIMYAMVELVWIPNSPLVGDIEDKDQFLMGGINLTQYVMVPWCSLMLCKFLWMGQAENALTSLLQ